MELSLSSRSQNLSLISFHPLSSTSTCLSPSRVRSLRREFLGSAHNLRPPGGIRSRRRKCSSSNLGLHNRSSRFVFRASLDTQSAFLVVTVFTVSALTLVFFNYSRRNNNNKKNVKEVSGPLFISISQHIRGIMNQFIKNQTSTLPDTERAAPPDISKNAQKETHESRHEVEDHTEQLQLNEIILLPQVTHIGDAVESSGLGVHASSVIDSVPSVVSEVTSTHSPSVLSKAGMPQPLHCNTVHSKLQVEGYPQETEFASELPALLEKTESSATTDCNGLLSLDDKKGSNSELVDVNEIISFSSAFRESGRQGLHTFYEAHESPEKSMSDFSGLATSSHASAQFSSLTRTSATNGENSSVLDFVRSREIKSVSSESIEEKTPLTFHKQGSSLNGTVLGRSRSIPRSDRTSKPQEWRKMYSAQPSPPSGMHVKDNGYVSRKISDYNPFLKDGRLLDCLELLEDLEQNGLLDMDKIYHAGFLKTCQRKRAVAEAFRFVKLIPNPSLSTFNMLMSVCASSQDSEGAFEVLRLAEEAGLKADCKLYTTLLSTCAKSGKVDTMFKVFHEMVSAGVEPNVHTYSSLIDGCAKAGQVAKAFGAYGILRSKNVQPDRVVFNALITACGQSGAVDRAFDVLAEMKAEVRPIDPDHITIGALMKACVNGGKVDRAREVYNMIDQYNIKGTPEVYTIAVNSCSQNGDWGFACNVFSDMKRKGVIPDEMFLSALIDVAGHAGKLDTAFAILQESKNQGIKLGIISYSSLMGACSNAKNWEKSLELYEDIKSIKLKPTVSTMNALITALCDGDQLQKALEILSDMKKAGLSPNTITYSLLLVASAKKNDLEVGLMLLSQAKKDGVTPNLVMSRCLIVMCLRRCEKACSLGDPAMSFTPGRAQIDSKWTSLALMVYRETLNAGIMPTVEVFSQVLACLQLPRDASLRDRLTENLVVNIDSPKRSNLWSLIDGFGEYDPRAFSLFEEAASIGIVPCASFKEGPIVVDARMLQIHTAEVYILTVLKSLKHRLAAGVKLPNITILLPVEKAHIQSETVEKTINLSARISQSVTALLRRLGLTYIGGESIGRIRINGVVVKHWFQPKPTSRFGGRRRGGFGSSQLRLGKGISHQQRNIRTGNLSLD